MAKASVVFKLDKTDQIMVDGKMLSRIVIDGYLVGKEPVTHFTTTLPDCRKQYWAGAKPVGTKGGYIDSLDNISTNVSIDGSHAWIDADSVVYDSEIGPYITIINSKVVDSTIKSAGVCDEYAGNLYALDDDPILRFGIIQNSAVISSELFNVTADNSVIRHSNVNRMTIYDSTLVETDINPKKMQWIFNSTIMHTTSRLNESFSHVNMNHINVGTELMRINHADDEGLIISTNAINNETGEPIMCVIYNNVTDYNGASDWKSLYDYLQNSDYKWSKNAKNKVRKMVK